MSWQNRKVWIIGASTGMGAALAKELCSLGAAVTISARDKEKLNQVSANQMAIIPLDIRDRTAVKAAANNYLEEHGAFDVIVLMAGYWQQMNAFNFSYDEFRQHQEVNLLGFASCIDAVLPSMIATNNGMLVGISSVAGFRGLSGSIAYGPSKAAQLNLLESLRIDLKQTNVKVLTVAPGFVTTPLTAKNEFSMPFLISAETAAKKIVAGMEKNKAEIVFPWQMKLIMGVARLIPSGIWPKIFKAKKQ